MKKLAIAMAFPVALFANEAHAQLGGRLSVEPYVAYGFFGDLPETSTTLEADVAFGAKVGYQLSPQFTAFVNGQRATPEGINGNVDHWSAGVEFAYVPRGGAEGMLPILLEAGLGQARYENGPSDFAANIGIASALQLSDNLGIRYGVNDYISNFNDGNGIVNQIFVRVGAELTL
jgi:hypothetical protein